MENNNLNVLDEVSKGTTMGMEAIHYIYNKVDDSELKNTLDVEYNKYKDISTRIDNLYAHYSDKEPHKPNIMTKMMSWYGIQMNTIKDQTSSKISELLMQGTNMGIIEGRRLLNHNENLEPDVEKILSDFVSMQEDSIETLKKFL